MKVLLKKIKNKIKQIDHRIIGTVIFAMLFVFLGALIPDVYYRYFDTKEYYSIDSIFVDTSKTYKPCEVMELTIARTALEDLTGEFTFVLSLEDIDNRNVYSKRVPSTVEAGTKVIKSEQLIPCNSGVGVDLRDGQYRWALGFEYTFKGIKKTAFNRSNLFKVKS
jgi:hypothetical protein